MTVSHVSVILLVLPCQLSSKSNSYISLPLLRLYISQCIFRCNHFNFVQQCIQISTRINSSMYICTSVFVSFETYPIFNRYQDDLGVTAIIILMCCLFIINLIYFDNIFYVTYCTILLVNCYVIVYVKNVVYVIFSPIYQVPK